MQRGSTREPKPLPRTQEWKVCSLPYLEHDLAQCGIRGRWHSTRLKAFARREEEKCPTHSLAVPWGQLASALSPLRFHWCRLGQGWSPGVHRRDRFLIKNSRIFFILLCIYIFTFTMVFPGTASSVCICWLWNICIAFPHCELRQASHGSYTHSNTSFTCVLWDSSSL